MPAISSGPEGDAARREWEKRRGRYVPWVIAAFYLTFMSALIGFVFIAYANPPADSTEEAYDKGLAYNDTIAKARAQDKLGWVSTIDYANGQVSFSLVDKAHKPILDATVQAWFVSPDRSALDRSVSLVSQGGGKYTAKALLPAKGAWTLHVTAGRDDQQYQAMSQIEVD